MAWNVYKVSPMTIAAVKATASMTTAGWYKVHTAPMLRLSNIVCIIKFDTDQCLFTCQIVSSVPCRVSNMLVIWHHAYFPHNVAHFVHMLTQMPNKIKFVG